MATILTADDTATMRQMISFTLGSAGHEVIQANDGAEALAIARTRKFDLVIADVNMPNMDGISLVKSLRDLPDYKFTPILMLTTESQEQRRQAGRTAGATGWIVKPFNPEQLLTVVKKVVG
jgi:two-component system, chemotaxis family, chemotaxis protein CheY